jgi:hypothetical protein
LDIAEQYPIAITAVNQGISIQESDARSDIAKSYEGLAEVLIQTFTLSGAPKSEDDQRKSGLLGRWIPVRGLLK